MRGTILTGVPQSGGSDTRSTNLDLSHAVSKNKAASLPNSKPCIRISFCNQHGHPNRHSNK